MSRFNHSARTTARWITGVVFILAGLNHFLHPRLYLQIMPPYLLPEQHLELVYLSGMLEMLGGAGLLIPSTRRPAGWLLLAVLVGVYPANIYMATNSEQFAEVAPAWVFWARLPFQCVLMALVWWVAREPHSGSAN